ncbi:MAG: hypothetical protein JXB46_09105 [Candidatus Eisenbacteria bacterium]|nr:hypothetical protein [Candidatus Eisenbacteria bacterium]
MRTTALVLIQLLVLLPVLVLPAGAAPMDPAPPDPLEARISEAVTGLIALDQERVKLDSGLGATQDILAEDIHLCVDPATAQFEARCTLSLKVVGGPVRLVLASGFQVTSVADSSGAELAHSRRGDVLSIMPAADAGSGTLQFTVGYRRALEASPGVWLDEQSVVLGADAHWYPTSERRDPAGLTVEVRYPAGYSSVMSGALSGMAPSEQSGGRCANGDIWSVPPEARGAALIVGRIESSLKVAGGVFVGYHRLLAGPGETDGRPRGAGVTMVPQEFLELLRFLESCYGPYPFEWLNVVSVPSASRVRVPVISGPGLVVIPVTGRDAADEMAVPAHRLAGPLADSWWRFWIDPSRLVSESLSAQAEIDWLDATGYEDAADQLRAFHRTQCMRAMHSSGGRASLSDCVGPEASGDDRICEGKGAAVLGILKEFIGEQAYCAALRATAEEHGGESTGIGTLIDAFERESGQDLDWFFYEWITRDDLPSYALDYVATRAGRGTYIVHGTILQQGEFYHTPVPLTIDLGGWAYEETVPIESSRQQFTLRTEAEPMQIVVDGRELIPKIDASEQALIHYERGSLAASSGRWKVAADELGAAALLDGTNAAYVHGYGEALVRLGRVTEGTQQLERAIELAPHDYDYRFGIAVVYLRLSMYGPALRHLDEYVRGRPEDRAGRIKRTVALVGLGRLDEASSTLELARDLPDGAVGSGALDADFFIASGFLLEARGEIQAAIRSYEAALAAYPVSDEARRRLSVIMESSSPGQGGR